jgi:hypothetical protein
MTREHHSNTHAPQLDSADDAKVEASPHDSTTAFEALTAFAEEGKGSARDVARMMKLLANRHKNELLMLMPKIGARMDGDQWLEAAAVFDYVSYFTIQVALEDAKPPASDAAIKKYLRNLSVEDFAELGKHEGVVATLRGTFKGPLGVVMPQLASLPGTAHATAAWCDAIHVPRYAIPRPAGGSAAA